MHDYISLLRHTAAILVVYAHSFLLMPTVNNDFFKYYLGLEVDTGFIAVNIFFLLSGMLIYKSAKNSSTLFEYFGKRFLRIYPALFVCVLLTTFAFWIDSNLNLNDFLNSNTNITYIKNLYLNGGYWIEDTFNNNYHPDFANGSLWTLKYEVMMYIIASIFVVSIAKNKSLFLLGVLFIVALVLYGVSKTDLVNIQIIDNIGRLGSYFFLGALLTHYYFKKADKLLWISLFGFILSIYFNIQVELISVFFIGILLKYSIDRVSDFVSTQAVTKINFDYSYGIYIYSYPVQQFLSKYISFDSNFLFFSYSIVISTMLAALSWHLIENKALQAKSLIPILQNRLFQTQLPIK